MGSQLVGRPGQATFQRSALETIRQTGGLSVSRTGGMIRRASVQTANGTGAATDNTNGAAINNRQAANAARSTSVGRVRQAGNLGAPRSVNRNFNG
jgi:hypothetical protein